MNLALLLSFLSLLLSLLLFFNRIRNLFFRWAVTIFSVLSFALIAGYHVSDILTNNGFDESVLFHIKMGLHGSGLADFWQIILYGTFLFIIVVLMANYTYKKIHTELPNRNNLFIVSAATALLFYSVLSNPIIDNLRTFFVYDSDQTFYDYYRAPQTGSYTKKSKKNIVYIYAESLERTYFDETLFPGLTSELKKIEKESISFENIFQVYATGWTIAGMTASQCGIPLVTPTGGNAMSGFKENFLPMATCLGDILHDEGYMLEYYGGSSLEFAGKGNFYTSHSFEKVQGKEELKSSLEDPSYMTGWGLYDDSLLEIVYDEFESLSQKSKPFGLFALTLDTHHPNGHLSKQCRENNIVYEDGSNSMLNAVKCSDYLLSKFIHKILASPYAEDTVIVVSSDHLAMPNVAYDKLEKGNRRNLLMVIDGSKNTSPKHVAAKGTMLDVAPTLMSILGYTSPQMGLGRDLLSEQSLIIEDNRAEKLANKKGSKYSDLSNEKRSYLSVLSINAMLASWRDTFLDFWKRSTFNDGIIINTREKSVIMGGLTIKYPVVIEADSHGRLIPKFNFDSRGRMQDMIVKEESKNIFVWIDQCNYMDNPINIYRSTKEICFALGNHKDDNIYITNVKDGLHLSKSTITALINNNTDNLEQNTFIHEKPSDILDNLDINQLFSERCHSLNLTPERIIDKYASESSIVLLSAYHLDTNGTFAAFFDLMDSQNSRLSKIGFNDLYLGVIKNRKLLTEKISSQKPVQYNHVFDGVAISITTAGLNTLFKSSIIANGLELSPNYQGINMVVVDLKTGNTHVYNFPTYPKDDS